MDARLLLIAGAVSSFAGVVLAAAKISGQVNDHGVAQVLVVLGMAAVVLGSWRAERERRERLRRSLAYEKALEDNALRVLLPDGERAVDLKEEWLAKPYVLAHGTMNSVLVHRNGSLVAILIPGACESSRRVMEAMNVAATIKVQVQAARTMSEGWR